MQNNDFFHVNLIDDYDFVKDISKDSRIYVNFPCFSLHLLIPSAFFVTEPCCFYFCLRLSSSNVSYDYRQMVSKVSFKNHPINVCNIKIFNIDVCSLSKLGIYNIEISVEFYNYKRISKSWDLIFNVPTVLDNTEKESISHASNSLSSEEFVELSIENVDADEIDNQLNVSTKHETPFFSTVNVIKDFIFSSKLAKAFHSVIVKSVEKTMDSFEAFSDYLSRQSSGSLYILGIEYRFENLRNSCKNIEIDFQRISEQFPDKLSVKTFIFDSCKHLEIEDRLGSLIDQNIHKIEIEEGLMKISHISFANLTINFMKSIISLIKDFDMKAFYCSQIVFNRSVTSHDMVISFSIFENEKFNFLIDEYSAEIYIPALEIHFSTHDTFYLKSSIEYNIICLFNENLGYLLLFVFDPKRIYFIKKSFSKFRDLQFDEDYLNYFSYSSTHFLVDRISTDTIPQSQAFNFLNHSNREIFSELVLDVQSRFHFTYRKQFPPLLNTEITSDYGWGCIIRSGQSLVAEAFSRLTFGRGK